MLARRVPRRRGLLMMVSVLSALSLGMVAFLGAQAGAVQGVMPVSGHLTSHVVAGPECASPVGICTAGTLNGGIQGDFQFTALTLTPTGVPTVFSYTGTIEVQTKDGDIHISDAGAFDTTGDGPVVDLSTITGGSGKFEGASGYIEIYGTFTFAAGGNSDYKGKVITS